MVILEWHCGVILKLFSNLHLDTPTCTDYCCIYFCRCLWTKSCFFFFASVTLVFSSCYILFHSTKDEIQIIPNPKPGLVSPHPMTRLQPSSDAVLCFDLQYHLLVTHIDSLLLLLLLFVVSFLPRAIEFGVETRWEWHNMLFSFAYVIRFEWRCAFFFTNIEICRFITLGLLSREWLNLYIDSSSKQNLSLVL